MAKKKDNSDAVFCPVGRFFADLEDVFGKKSKVFNHLKKSRVEFLKAIRTLVDEKIESLDKKGPAKKGGKRTRIKVE
ncbi:MAG: hypothetical protein JRC68_08845 [Deltaproteobacteria bacterium]|nr:hypothetical protein [Deltaproteobacteria bacterium]